jgi:hypothetical protein
MPRFTQLFEDGLDLAATAKPAEDASFGGIKELAKKDIGVLKQLAFLNKLYHGDDPRFTSKEAKIAMSAVLSKLVYDDDKTAYFLGTMDWEPNVAVWMRFFDMVGEKPLGQYLGINSANELPKFNDDNGEHFGSADEQGGDMPVADAFPPGPGAAASPDTGTGEEFAPAPAPMGPEQEEVNLSDYGL